MLSRRRFLIHNVKMTFEEDCPQQAVQPKLTKYTCSEADCHFQTAYKNSLSRHRASHRTNYPCTNCPKKYAYPVDLQAHIETVHQEQYVACCFCAKRFQSPCDRSQRAHRLESMPLSKEYRISYYTTSYICLGIDKQCIIHE